MSTNLQMSPLDPDWNQEPIARGSNLSSASYHSSVSAATMVGRSGISPSGMVVVFPPLSRRAKGGSNRRIAAASTPVQFSLPDRRTIYDVVKRGLDLIGATALLIVLAPLLALVALAVKLDSAGPVIFAQRRLTIGGKVFTMLKFRTMRADAESATGAVWAAKSDPRVTSIGRYLRVFRLDELPQLINVIRGEMSLIGPRPERPEIATDLSKDLPSFNHRLAVKAGITGLAQTTSGYASSVESYRKKLAWDILYVRNRCLLLDLRIAIKTVFVVLTGSGAR